MLELGHIRRFPYEYNMQRPIIFLMSVHVILRIRASEEADDGLYRGRLLLAARAQVELTT